MKKRIISVLLLICMALGLMLTGCKKSVNMADFVIPEGGYDGSEVTITFYHTMGQNLRDVLDKYIVKFNEMFPNIHIEHKQVGSYDDVREQISTELTVGAQPNIAYCYPDHVALYNDAKAVVTLDELIASDIEVTDALGNTTILGLTEAQINDFIPGYYAEGKAFGDNKMYTLPMSKSTEVLYYNKTFFDANNLTVPTTWEEMEALCKQIKALDPTCIPLGYDSEANWFITMCEQQGSPYTSATGDHFLFNNDANKAFVKQFRSWYQQGLMTTQTLNSGYTSDLFKNMDPEAPRSYMSIGSSAGATHQRPDKLTNGEYPFEVGIATIPQVDASNPKVISQGPSLCIFKDDDPQKVIASWLFVKYLTTTVEFQASFSLASGYVPVLKSVADHPIYKAEMDKANGGDFIAMLSAKICMEQADAYYTSPAFNGSSFARTEVQKLMTQAFSGNDGGNLDSFIDRLFKAAIEECEYNS